VVQAWASGISRASPGKSEPGCKPFIRLVAIQPRAAAIADSGPIRRCLQPAGLIPARVTMDWDLSQASVGKSILLRADEVWIETA